MLDNLFTPTHLIIILVIALLIFGPRKLPELGKGLGEGLRGFKDGIKGATNADQLAAKWNEEADERKTIAWPEGQFIALQRKVKVAIDSMRAPV